MRLAQPLKKLLRAGRSSCRKSESIELDAERGGTGLRCGGGRRSALLVLLGMGVVLAGGLRAAVCVQGAAEGETGVEDTFSYGTEGTIWLVPHSHYDVAWLEPEFATAGRIAERYRDHVSQALDEAGYRFVLDQVPALQTFLFSYPIEADSLGQLVKEGRAQLVGGLYIQPDENLPEGETLLQEAVLGQRYLKETFGLYSRSGFDIDSFGHSWQMPQILRAGGMEEFAFARAGDEQKPPASEFWWVAPDGSRVLAAWMVKGYDVAQALGRSSNIAKEQAKIMDIYRQLRPYAATPNVLIPVGGDYAAPPSELVRLAKDWNARHTDVKMNVATLADFFAAVRRAEANGVKIPEFAAESNRVFPGYYSARIWIKQRNRAAEHQLMVAERLATFASLLDPAYTYPEPELTQAWTALALNQFHDLLPATAVDGVYDRMEQRYEKVETAVQEIAGKAVISLARYAGVDPSETSRPTRLLLFNPLNWDRQEIVRLRIPAVQGASQGASPTLFRLLDDRGNEVPYQILQPVGQYRDAFGARSLTTAWAPLAPGTYGAADRAGIDGGETSAAGEDGWEIAFVASVPAAGYRIYSLEWGHAPARSPEEKEVNLEPNEQGDTLVTTAAYRLVMDEGGNIRELSSESEPDRTWIKEIPATSWSEPVRGNGIRIATDESNAYFPDGNSHLVASTVGQPSTARVLAGPVMTRVIHRTELPQAVIVREIDLPERPGRIEFITSMDWRDKKKVVQVTMPTTGRGETTFEIPYGFITGRSPGQWPAVKWVDTSSAETGGVSLLNRGLPDHEVYGGSYRLTLLRSIDYTFFRHGDSPQALGIGSHRFEYALFPHSGTWQEARVDRQAWEYNEPLIAVWGEPLPGSTRGSTLASFLQTSANLIVTAVRRFGEKVVVRAVEALGKEAGAEIVWQIAPSPSQPEVYPVNGLLQKVERGFTKLAEGKGVQWQARPQEIATWLWGCQ